MTEALSYKEILQNNIDTSTNNLCTAEVKVAPSEEDV